MSSVIHSPRVLQTSGARPIFRGIDTTEALSGVSNLDRNLTINGTTVAPTFWYKGEDASGTTWPAEVGGADGLLTEAGSGASPSYAQGTPLMGTDAAVKYNAAKYHAAPGTAFGNVTTEDMVIAVLFQPNSSTANRRIGGKLKTSGGAVGWQLNFNGSAVQCAIYDASGSAIVASAGLTIGAWNYLEFYLDRSGSGMVYLNGQAGTAVDISARQLTLTHTGDTFQIGAANSANPIAADVALLAMWQRAAWLDTHLQATLAAQRFLALTGFRPQVSNVGVDTAPLSYTRATNATLEKYNATTGKTEFYTVGSGWLRQERWLSNGVVVSGYRAELASTNKITYSSVTEATWTKADAGDTTTAVDGPWGTAAAEGWVADATDGDHSRLLACTTTAAAHVFWARVKAGAAPFIALYDPISDVGRYFDSATGALGGAMGDAPTTSYARVDEDGSGWMIIAMVWTATAAARNLTIYPCDADGDPTVTGDGATAELLFSHAQCELVTVDSSPIKTSGGTATRNKDDLRYSTSHAGATGAIVVDVVIRQAFGTGGIAYPVSVDDGGLTNRSILYSSVTAAVVRGSVNVDGLPNGTTTVTDGVTRRWGMRWKVNDASVWLNGAQEGIDTAVTVPGAMDRINIGQRHDGGYQPSSPTLIRRVCVYNTYPASMARLTTL